MRPFSLLIILTLLSVNSLAQATKRPKPAIYSTTSDWQKITFKQTARVRPTQSIASTTAPSERTPAPVSQPGATLGGANQPGEKVNSSIQPNVSQPNVAQPVMNQPVADQPDAVVPPNTNAPRKSNNPLAPVATTDAPITRTSRTSQSGATSADFHPAFTGDFATNRNGWKAGNKGDYNYQIGLGRYNIRKRNANTQQVAFSYVPLPTDINLNTADMFTLKVDVLADSGRVPTGGLMFGVKDSLNFCAFTLNGKGEISIVRVANGETFGDYMPGDFFAPGVPVDKNRNRLIIRRKGDELHFYINEQEVRSSPYPFRQFSGHNIGMLTSAYWTSFQKLSVTLGN